MDPRSVIPRGAPLSFDLFRHEVILNARLPTDHTTLENADDIVQPLALIMRKRDNEVRDGSVTRSQGIGDARTCESDYWIEPGGASHAHRRVGVSNW